MCVCVCDPTISVDYKYELKLILEGETGDGVSDYICSQKYPHISLGSFNSIMI